MKKMRIELRERIKTTDEEFNSVKENDKLTLSEELYNTSKPKHRRAKHDPLTEEFTLDAQDGFNE